MPQWSTGIKPPAALSTLSSKIRDQMSIAAVRPAPDFLRRVVRLQVLTIVWMTIESVVALVAAWTPRTPALLGFVGDSGIELFSATILLMRFHSNPHSSVAHT